MYERSPASSAQKAAFDQIQPCCAVTVLKGKDETKPGFADWTTYYKFYDWPTDPVNPTWRICINNPSTFFAGTGYIDRLQNDAQFEKSGFRYHT